MQKFIGLRADFSHEYSKSFNQYQAKLMVKNILGRDIFQNQLNIHVKEVHEYLYNKIFVAFEHGKTCFCEDCI